MWHRVFYPSRLGFLTPLTFTIYQKLDGGTLERFRSGWRRGFGLTQDAAPTCPWWERAGLRLRLASGSAGGELQEHGGAETGVGSLGPQADMTET